MAKTVNDWLTFLEEIEKQVLTEEPLTFNQALTLTKLPDKFVNQLCNVAVNVRQHFNADNVDLCSIINARSGRCPEDCKFCAQSSHYKTKIKVYPMKTVKEILTAAKQAEQKGAKRFCIVTSGPALSEKDFHTALQAIQKIKETTSLKRCASLGQLTRDRAQKLKQAGLNRYHHNIETAPTFFRSICTTHSFADKLKTVSHLKAAGIETCVGGILNLGETPRQRIEFAFALKKINPVSVPINFLNPRPGTPLANRPLMLPLEAAKYLAIFRLILPRSYIRLAGGRVETFASQPALPFLAGANALLIGNLLTTKGPAVEQDLKLLQELKFNVQ